MAENRCVICGQIIPEGRQVCPSCGDITDKNFKSNNFEVMSNKEIEELATEIYTLFQSRPMSRALAHRLYDKGWRKQSEGEWVDQYKGKYANPIYVCSLCGKGTLLTPYINELNNMEMTQALSPFCPNCGAKMKGGAE
jgi:rubrerythrin